MHLIYARVSSVEQGRPGAASIPEQLQACRAVAMARGAQHVDTVEYVDNGVSGSIKLDTRPYGRELVLHLREGDTVIASKVDRLFRSAADALHWQENFKKIGVKLIIVALGFEPVADNAIAKLLFGTLSLMSEFERECIHERCTEGRRVKLNRGGYCGGRVPYGMQVIGSGRDAVLEAHPGEVEMIDKVKRMARDGHKSSRIARYLTVHYPTRSGKPWQQVQVDRILNG